MPAPRSRQPGGWLADDRQLHTPVVNAIRDMHLAAALLLCCVAFGAACRARPVVPEVPVEPYLLVWAGDADRLHDDFLAVIDVDPGSPTYASVVHTVPVGSRSNEPFAMDSVFGADGIVFAGGLLSGRTFVFDVRNPRQASLLREDVPGPGRRYAGARAYLRLPSGHRIATCGDRRDYRGGAVELLTSPGGFVEFGSAGRFIRELDASDPAAAGMVTLCTARSGTSNRTVSVATTLVTAPSGLLTMTS